MLFGLHSAILGYILWLMAIGLARRRRDPGTEVFVNSPTLACGLSALD